MDSNSFDVCPQRDLLIIILMNVSRSMTLVCSLSHIRDIVIEHHDQNV